MVLRESIYCPLFLMTFITLLLPTRIELKYQLIRYRN